MMKRILIAAAIAAVGGMAQADITLKFPADIVGKDVMVQAQDIKSLAEAKSKSDIIGRMDTVKAGDKVVIKDMLDTPARYRIGTDEDMLVMLYAAPGQNISVDLSNPSSPVMTGSVLVEQMNDFETHLMEYGDAYMQARNNNDEKAMEQVMSDFNNYINSYLESNLDSEIAPYILTKLDDPEQLVASFARLGDNAKGSIIYPLAVSAVSKAEKQIERDRLQASLTGNASPDFMLPDLDGNMKSLADYRGKWVILDFWGSWCPWCIKGFPELKELYAKYAPAELEIIGVDCREDDAAWRKGVADHELPWVQLYNSADAGAESLFGVSGYPTKVIIDPEGKVAKIVVGHTPDFTLTLESLMGK